LKGSITSRGKEKGSLCTESSPRIAGRMSAGCGVQRANEGRIQSASGPGWMNSIVLDPAHLACADLRPAVFSLTWKALIWLRTAHRGSNAGGLALPRAVLRLRSLPAGAGLPEKTKKAFHWTVYCSPATAPKTLKALRTRQLSPR
jgi:hypothetical protein